MRMRQKEWERAFKQPTLTHSPFNRIFFCRVLIGIHPYIWLEKLVPAHANITIIANHHPTHTHTHIHILLFDIYSLTRNCGKRRESLPPPLPPPTLLLGLLLLLLSALWCSWFGLAECSLLLLFITVGFIVNFMFFSSVSAKRSTALLLFDLIKYFEMAWSLWLGKINVSRRPFRNCYFANQSQAIRISQSSHSFHYRTESLNWFDLYLWHLNRDLSLDLLYSKKFLQRKENRIV